MNITGKNAITRTKREEAVSSKSPHSGYQLGNELAEILIARFPDSTCTHLVNTASSPATYGDWPAWVYPPLQSWYEAHDIQRPFAHQVQAAELIHNGHNVVIATGTSSGKSLVYQLSVLSRLASAPHACALYLTPTKALGSDQLTRIQTLCQEIEGLQDIFPAPYDGDTPSDARRGIRDHSRWVFSNPDMLHAGILPNHQRWQRLLRNLEFIIVDECHAYRGVFGAHVSLVLRRLLRLCRKLGASPQIILASATINNPQDHAQNLCGEPVLAVEYDSAAQGSRTIMLWEPGLVEEESAEPTRRAASTEVASLMAVVVAEGARTLSFVRSRRQAEIVALRCAEILSLQGKPELAQQIAAYRAGYLAEDRRALEAALNDGRLVGVASTNALELGIDVGGLDAVLMAGFPGTVASFWQQAGRAGRRGQSALVVLVGRDEPMDNYLTHHPEALLGKPLENVVFNPYNPHILIDHVRCAALEAPLRQEEVTALKAEAVVDKLREQGHLRWRGQGWFPSLRPGEPLPHEQLSLRGSGHQVVIVDESDGRLLGHCDMASACAQVHPGAIYLHQGESFVISTLDLDQGIAYAKPEFPNYSVYARSTTDIRIVQAPDRVENPSPGFWVSNLEVEVNTQVTGYVRKTPTGEILDMVPLDLPSSTLVTRAVAYTIDPLVLDKLGISDIPGALHAAEHAAIGILPLIATCDRWDIGGVSTALHPDTGLPTVFVYDGTPGGAGFADCGYEHFGQWIAATYQVVKDCSCTSDTGCPSCIQSPKCGNGNSPLSKEGAIALLGALCTMLGQTP